jgi:4-amino-4-deoxy-L-arabinose transferase-like glycosyltransferase
MHKFWHWLRKGSTLFWIGLVFVFLLALLPRLSSPVMRPMVWYKRSVYFWDAVLAGDWGGTYQFYHPAVTVMWVTGLGLRIYAVTHGWTGNDLLNPPVGASGIGHYPIEAGVAALAFAIAVCIVIAYVLLTRLMDWPVAFCAGCLLALDPFFLAFSKVILVDALLAGLMLVSALAFLCYQRRKRWGYLMLSGLFAGLAFLTKSPSAFLFPYVLLVAVASSFWLLKTRLASELRHSWGLWRIARAVAGRLWAIAWTVGSWVVIAGLVFVLAWPVMWSNPLKAIFKIGLSIIFWSGEPHHDLFLAGRVVDDPGLLFYLATVAWKTTLITLPAIPAAVVFLLRRWRERKSDRYVWWLLIYAAGFFLMMAIGAKKRRPYLIPTFLALDILAAWAVVQVARAVGRGKRFVSLTWVPAAVVAMALAVQAGAVLRHHPYYDVHHNLLLGGLPVAQHILPLGDQGEGLDQAARFLNGYPGAERRTVGVQKRFVDSFERDFVGRTQRINEPGADYRVFAVNVNQRGLNAEEWEDMWQVCQREGSLWSVSFDSVPYAWVCPAYPTDPEIFAIDHRSDARLDDHISLLGYELSATRLSAGDALTVTLFWQSDGRLVADYHVFVHLLDADGQMVAQHDGVPMQGERPTWDWRDREVLRDDHALLVDADTSPGTYTLAAGMYDFQTIIRLPVTGLGGNGLSDDRVPLGQVVIEP